MRYRNPPKTRIELARTELINVVGGYMRMEVVVLTFNGGSRGSSFKPNLVVLNDSVRAQLKNWLNLPAQRPGGGTYPWLQMEKALKVSVKQVHVISDGLPLKSCFKGTCGDAALIFKRNDSRDPKSLILKSYSLDEDFCTEIIHGIEFVY